MDNPLRNPSWCVQVIKPLPIILCRQKTEGGAKEIALVRLWEKGMIG